MKINYDIKWQYSIDTCVRTSIITAHGNTPDEVVMDLKQQIQTFQEPHHSLDGESPFTNTMWNNDTKHVTGTTAIGTRNTRNDWEQMYGPVDDPDCAFGDEFEQSDIVDRYAESKYRLWNKIKSFFRRAK